MNSRVEFRIFTIVDLDKEEEHLHEMHLKGWRYRPVVLVCSILTNVNQTMSSTVSMILNFLKKYKHELQDFRDRGWELIGVGSCSILRKSSSDLLPEDQVCMSKGLKWEVMQSDFVPVQLLSQVVLLFV